MTNQELRDEISQFTRSIKDFACNNDDFESALIICNDLKNFLKKSSQKTDSGGKDE